VNKQWEMVKEFHLKYSHEIGKIPKKLTDKQVDIRYEYLQEELDEFMAAETLVEQYDALLDLGYFLLGTLVMMNLPFDEGFKIVHEANMTKKPNKDKHKKVEKGDEFLKPEEKLQELIDGLIKQ
jgi:predicted HAD superfamily Cof-like phosphohydrolase